MNNTRFLKALNRQAVDRTPVWIMRQAGRYLPEYRMTRGQAGDFMSLCRNPQLANEVTLQPLKRFPHLDAAILFSDILTIPDAMGLGLQFVENEGPKFSYPVRDRSSINALKVPNMKTDLGYVMEAVRTISSSLQGLSTTLPLIGFSGSPWTLACYMVEGSSSKDFATIKSMIYSDRQALNDLLQILTESVIAYLNAQIEAGAQVVQIFDTWGGLLSHAAYEDFSLAPMAKIIQNITDASIPIILFTKGGGLWLESMADSGADAIGLDWTVDLKDAKRRVGDKVALQGNMDPSVLLGSDESIISEVQRILQAYSGEPGHIFNLGHGITPRVKPEKVTVMLNAIHEFSNKGDNG